MSAQIYTNKTNARKDFEKAMGHNILHIDNTLRREYTGNHYERYGDSKPRKKYGQVSAPSHLRGMSDHQVKRLHKVHLP